MNYQVLVKNMEYAYCVFTSEKLLLVMRPYQIATTEKILNRIIISTNMRKTGKKEAGGYIWHTTGSGKSLTSFKVAQLATDLKTLTKYFLLWTEKTLTIKQ